MGPAEPFYHRCSVLVDARKIGSKTTRTEDIMRTFSKYEAHRACRRVRFNAAMAYCCFSSTTMAANSGTTGPSCLYRASWYHQRAFDSPKSAFVYFPLLVTNCLHAPRRAGHPLRHLPNITVPLSAKACARASYNSLLKPRTLTLTPAHSLLPSGMREHRDPTSGGPLFNRAYRAL